MKTIENGLEVLCDRGAKDLIALAPNVFKTQTPTTSGKKGKKKAAESQSVAFTPTLSQSTASTSTLSQSLASTPTYGTRSSTAKSVGSNVSMPAWVEGEGSSH
ncbi:hypothetical protein EI94DRAFT_1703736 [Lactarius quietus]|nr:hypothetical protein EI94DRAFT_1703736 [Lactarius quietus]